MANIWKENANVNEHPNRNNFDLSYQNHLTMKLGGLYPIMCKEVVPGDSFEIDTMFGLKFMPLVFPVQSRMRCHVSYFYVRNKNLWKNWENFISGLKEHTHPYIQQPAEFFKTGSLADYLDVPTTAVGVDSIMTMFDSQYNGYGIYIPHVAPGANGQIQIISNASQFIMDGSCVLPYRLLDNPPDGLWPNIVDVAASGQSHLMYVFENPLRPSRLNDPIDTGKYMRFYLHGATSVNIPCHWVVWRRPKNQDGYVNNNNITGNSNTSYATYGSTGWNTYHNSYSLYSHATSQSVGACRLVTSQDEANCVELLFDTSDSESMFVNIMNQINEFNNDNGHQYDYIFGLCVTESDATSVGLNHSHEYPDKDSGVFFTGRYKYYSDHIDVVDISQTDNPFHQDVKDGRIMLNALPFRAYESIYRAYFQNTQNQPFIVNGEEVFNQYNTTLEDGADTTPYHLFFRNYEQDFLTSAMPSPQFGPAPLVGMSALGDITIEDENGITTGHAEIDDDGTITKISVTSPLASIEHGRTIMNIAQSGMSISDFRNVNALQRFLETTLRKGYKYKDFIEGHFGSSPHYATLDMPEFIGGVSQDVNVSTITNMTKSDNSSPLGDFAGIANCFGASPHKVRQYFDDYGFIIGIACVVPDPAYSQLLPKHYLHQQQLDYYFPEFSQLSMQPITYREVCPVQAYLDYVVDAEKRLTDTFGYQRPNYDLVGYTNQVHGQFRTTLKDYLVNRLFEHRPELGTEFLEINPKEINDIFVYTDSDTDTIIGQFVLDIKAKRPVPRITIPSLGR